MATENKIMAKANEAVVRADNLPISLKHCVAVCKFINNKAPDRAISLLSEVLKKKIAIPIKGEIPHRKGMMSGRYPEKASEYFIKMIRNVVANASVKGMNIENLELHGMANKGTTFHHGGRRRGEAKRTHVTITARERNAKKGEDKK